MGRLFDFWHFIRRHKYAVALIIFGLILAVVDENSLMMRYQRQVEIGNLRREIDKYQDEYDANTQQLEALEHTPGMAEKMARERYYMKRQGEDVFVFMKAEDIEIRQRLEKPAPESYPKNAVAENSIPRMSNCKNVPAQAPTKQPKIQ